MDLTWRRASADVWTSGDYVIARRWLYDGKRGRRYEVTTPNGATAQFRTLDKAQEYCRLHATVADLQRQFAAAAADYLASWNRAVVGLAAEFQPIAERIKAAFVRR